jgi:hypothetical protein
MRTVLWSGALVLVSAQIFSCSSSSESGGAGGSAAGGAATGGAAGSSAGGTSAGGTASGGIGNVGNGGSTGGSAGAGNQSGTGAAGGGGIGADAGIPDVSFTYDGPVEQDGSVGDACAVTSVKADPAPLDMYIMLDNSGSMGLDCALGSGGTSKWCYAITALDQFFKAAPAGTGVALQYFPKCWKSLAECTTGASCAIPEVALGNLPGNLNPLEASLNANAPGGTTPMEAALHGLATYTTQSKQPGRVMIGIFITDGVPEACSLNDNVLAQIIGNHLSIDKIKTFVIGMTGADDNRLNTLASQGGAVPHTSYCGSVTPSCYHYNVGNGNPAAFTAVLQSIQQSAVACQFTMPKSDAGIIDPSKVEVSYSPGGNPPAQKLPKVDDATKCGGTGGWYYDNNANPTSISLCPSTCSVVQVDSKAKIDVSLGCLGS